MGFPHPKPQSTFHMNYRQNSYLCRTMGRVSIQLRNYLPIATTVRNSHKKCCNILIPLPPLAEQKRIVEKIDRLMALCDRLEQYLEAATHQQTRLLQAVMAQI
jgi:hypothetical protein